ncbi:MAG: hypothetical protein ACRCV3_00985 [Desulfovibrionaceae bacterium]
MKITYLLSCVAMLFSLLLANEYVSVASAMEHMGKPCRSGMKMPCVCSSVDSSVAALRASYQKLTIAVQKKDMPSVKQSAKEVADAIASMKDEKSKKDFEHVHKYAMELSTVKTEKDTERVYSELTKSFNQVCNSCGCASMNKAM